MADKRDSITYQINFETSGGQGAIDKLSGALDRLGSDADKVSSGGNSSLKALATKAYGFSGLQGQVNGVTEFVGQQLATLLGGALKSIAGVNPLSEIDAETQTIEAVASAEETRGRVFGRGSPDEQLLQEARSIHEVLQRGVEARDRAKVVLATRQGGLVDRVMETYGDYVARPIVNRMLGFFE